RCFLARLAPTVGLSLEGLAEVRFACWTPPATRNFESFDSGMAQARYRHVCLHRMTVRFSPYATKTSASGMYLQRKWNVHSHSTILMISGGTNAPSAPMG